MWIGRLFSNISEMGKGCQLAREPWREHCGNLRELGELDAVTRPAGQLNFFTCFSESGAKVNSEQHTVTPDVDFDLA